ncbi:hypothetical protein HNP82_000732 [Catenibacillus scindens]|uniref:Uncharacterized protein n=1 Tax=Catenibacillus scindens TaxID=673271 RepID=A0A7W8M4A2_9FIRM|nr:hypothetical protein [Catenibacillus scindens]MBB5263634.1 hypothetical protein [Catenibacillus scindens]
MEGKQKHKDNEFLPKRGKPQHETVTYEISGTFIDFSHCGRYTILARSYSSQELLSFQYAPSFCFHEVKLDTIFGKQNPPLP